MASRKSKKYSPKEIRLPGSNIPANSIKIFNTLLVDTELYAEAIFKSKAASINEMRHLRDLMNWGAVSLKNRGYLRQEEVISAGHIHDKAAVAFNSLLVQGINSNGEFLFSEAEISAVIDALDVYLPYLKEQLELSPRQTMVEYMASFSDVDEIKQKGLSGEKRVLLFKEVNIEQFRQKTRRFFGKEKRFQ